MKNRSTNLSMLLAGAALGASSLLVLQNLPESAISSAEAAGGIVPGPYVEAPDRYVYYPGTEVLAEDDVRVTACSTGMPDARRGQASACFLFEFDNGEWGPAFNAQNEMLDEHSRKYNLEEVDWRPAKPWYEKGE